jgi:hypothetical protein
VRHVKANIFCNGGARFEATVDLNKKGHQGKFSSCVKNEDLIFPRQQYNYKEHREEDDKTDGHKLLLDALKLIGISGCDRVLCYRGIFQLGPD